MQAGGIAGLVDIRQGRGVDVYSGKGPARPAPEGGGERAQATECSKSELFSHWGLSADGNYVHSLRIHFVTGILVRMVAMYILSLFTL